MGKKKTKSWVVIVFVLLIIAWLFLIKWSDLLSRQNLAPFFGIFASIAFLVAIKYQDNQTSK